jgi:NADPH:quinone reductase-like Zn-dependent oxidoreductase
MRYQAYLEQCNADSLTMIDAEVPRPGPGQVLVKMRAASLNYRDLFILQGLYPGVDSKDLVPLSDGAGEVVETGAGVDRFAAGDHVIGTFFETWIAGRLQPNYFGKTLGGTAPGVLTEYRLFPQESLVTKPAHLSFEEAATLPCAALTA